MSLLLNLMENRKIPPKAETKAQRMEIIIDSLLENLPTPVKFLAENFITSSLPFNDENAEKTAACLLELYQFLEMGLLPNEEPTATNY